jgi:hypothetical protein
MYDNYVMRKSVFNVAHPGHPSGGYLAVADRGVFSGLEGL